MAKSQKAKGGKSRKAGREKEKRKRRGSPISMYVRDKITFDQYLKMAGSTRK